MTLFIEQLLLLCRRIRDCVVCVYCKCIMKETSDVQVALDRCIMGSWLTSNQPLVYLGWWCVVCGYVVTQTNPSQGSANELLGQRDQLYSAQGTTIEYYQV